MNFYNQLKNIGKGIKFIAKHPLESAVIGSTLLGIGCGREFKGNVENKIAFFREGKQDYNFAFIMNDGTKKVFYVTDFNLSRNIDLSIPYLDTTAINKRYCIEVYPSLLKIIIEDGEDISRIGTFDSTSFNGNLDDLFRDDNRKFYLIRE